MTWTLLMEDEPHPGWHNMALDEALLDLASHRGRGFLRCYRWRPGCISFGRHEPALRRYDRARIAAHGLDTVRRPTGGRAVWHDRELTYAVAAPQSAFGSLPVAYRAIHDTIRRALCSLGAAATLAPAPARTPGVGSGACFSQPVGGEVVVAGRKIVGSAQLRRTGAFLQHGSVLLEGDQSVIGRVTRGPAPPGADACLGAVLGRPVPWHEVAEALAHEAREWGGPWRTAGPEELAPIATRHEVRYRSDDWTWRR